MLILIEGPDCSGKSTLASRLACELEKQFPDNTVTMLHKGPPESHPLDEYETPLFGYRPQRGKHIICDRWHWGESVYPTVLRRPSLMDDGVRFHIELFLRSRGAIIVHVLADDRELEQCISRRGDDLIESGNGRQLNELYGIVEDTTLLPVIAVNGRQVTEDTIHAIIHRAGVESTAAVKLNEFVTYVGPPSPKLLLIGDVRHNLDVDGPDWQQPAFMPYQSTSGHYLANALVRHADIRWLRTIGIVNACDVDDVHLLRHTIDRPVSVALGRKASKVAHWVDGSVHHPQFIRRFKHGSAAEYANSIIDHSRARFYDRYEGL